MAAKLESDNEVKTFKKFDKRKYSDKRGFKQNGRNNNHRSFNRNSDAANSRTDSSSSERDNKVGRANDPEWYAHDPNLLRDAFNIPYTYPLGGKVPYTNAVKTAQNGFPAYDYVPGIAIMHLITGPGKADDINSAVNIAARDIYSFVRHANSGHSNYDPVDLMMYLLAVDEADMWYYNACRAYGVLTLYNNQNRYAPKEIVNALGFNYNDCVNHMADFRYKINAYAARLNALNVPSNFPLLKRHAWLYSSLYLDGTSAKAQIYAFAPAGYRYYNETVTTGSELTYVKIPGVGTGEGGITVDVFGTICDTLVNKLTGSEDIGIISGDILKAFSSANLIKLPTLDENYSVTPVFNEEVLSQFQNATIQCYGGASLADTTWNITQDPTLDQGTIKFNPGFLMDEEMAKLPTEMNPMFENARITLMKDSPTVEDTAVATRLTTIPSTIDTSGTQPKKYLGSFGSEIAVGLMMYTLTEQGKRYFIDASTYTALHYEKGGGDYWVYEDTYVTAYMRTVTTLSQFDYAPILYYVVPNVSMPSIEPRETESVDVYRIQDVANYAVVTPGVLDNMHNTAILSEFSVPLKYASL